MNKKNNNKSKKINKPESNNTSSNNVIKIKSNFESKNLIHTKKLKIMLISIVIIFILLLVRIAYIQFFQTKDGMKLKELAYKQQTINQIISPKRGNIYDSTGKALAISAQVDTITINPGKIEKKKPEDTKEYKEKVAKGLSEIFALDYEETLAKVNSEAKVETIAKKVEKEKVDLLKEWMKDNNIEVGINIDEDSKRYYPYGTIASSVLGFTGNDNQGLDGIEAKWDSVLTGTPGKIVSSKGSDQNEIPNAKETYISAENGSDLTLTLDLTIQSIIEKYLKQAVDENECVRGGDVIVMDPKTGYILGMATYPNYDLNSPYTPNATLAKTYDSLSNEEKNIALYKMWSNKSVAETYEPGSTFKVITSAIALEENITTTDKAKDFYCKGFEQIADRRINCWSSKPHGEQDLRHALMNSCNPAYMQLGARITAPVLYKYYNAFGLFESTNSGLYGEQSSIFYDLNKVGPVELATMSFGQRFNVTPLQMITAISAIANDGVLMQPKIVKGITNTDTGTTTEIPTTPVRQVVSKETANEVKSMMESVVTLGSGKHGAVTGYSIGGKTGTSEPTEKNIDNGFVASYIAISPVEDTKVTLLLNLYDPKGPNGYQGGLVAGPVVSQMLSEILPYLEVPSNKDISDNTDSANLLTVPEIRNKTVAEAEKTLKNIGFNVKTYVNGDKNSILVKEQNPKPGAALPKNSIIILYGEGTEIATSVTVPDLKGMNASQALTTLKDKNLNISIEGSGNVITQDYSKNDQVEEGTIIKVTLKQRLSSGH